METKQTCISNGKQRQLELVSKTNKQQPEPRISTNQSDVCLIDVN